jgi:Ca-activated chloride channel homolog
MDWFSQDWFRVNTFRDFVWDSPVFLYLIPFVPLIFVLRWLLNIRFRQKLPFSLSARSLPGGSWVWLRLVPKLLAGLALGLFLVALARPQRLVSEAEFTSEGIDIMLVLDISQSMLEKDFQPNRLETAKQVARNFVKGRQQDRIGIVVFSGEAYSLVPLTTDYLLVNQAINEIYPQLIRSEGTAIGSALAVMTNRMRESEAKTQVAVLISDGDNTAGNIEPITAAELAFMHRIKVYTILMADERKKLAGDTLTSKTLDEKTLRQIAEVCEGKFFRANDNQALTTIFNQINTFEKSEVKEVRYEQKQDFYTVYLCWGLVFLLLWLLSRATFMYNILED